MNERLWNRGLRRGAVIAVALALLHAAPALAARVVDVRVGQHKDFARVVFELDAPAGYKVERNVPRPGVAELVVSLDAAARSARLARKADLIKGVEVTGTGETAVARVRLARDGLKLKEMILANPPRIVLDVLDDRPKAAPKPTKKKKMAAAKPAPKPAPKAASKPAPAADDEALKQAIRRAALEKQAEERKAKQQQESAAAAAAAAAEAAKTQAASEVPTQTPPAPAPVRRAPTPVVAEPPDAVAPEGQQLAMADTPSDAAGQPGGMAAPTRTAPSPRPAPPAAATSRPKIVPPPAAAPVAEEPGLFSLTNIGIAAAGVLLIAAVAFLVIRRRNAAEVVDASAFDNPLGEENPFAGFEAEEGAAPSEAGAELDPTPVDPNEPEIAGEAVAETTIEKGTPMDTSMENAQTTIMNAPPAGASATSMGGDDVSHMLREFERRMQAMESRIEELSEAKERLERQVAAQTEELRVQRAAIARTQRAVRNLNRPDEDSPTEPALRDPERPEGPRQ